MPISTTKVNNMNARPNTVQSAVALLTETLDDHQGSRIDMRFNDAGLRELKPHVAQFFDGDHEEPALTADGDTHDEALVNLAVMAFEHLVG
jgi:hypothetical protein